MYHVSQVPQLLPVVFVQPQTQTWIKATDEKKIEKMQDICNKETKTTAASLQVHINQWESPAKLWMSLFCRVRETEGQKNRFQSRNIFMFQTSEKTLYIFLGNLLLYSIP